MTKASKFTESNFLDSPDKQMKVVEENDPLPGKPSDGTNDLASVDQPLETVLALEVNCRDNCKAYCTTSCNTGVSGGGNTKSSLMAKRSNERTKSTLSPPICHQEKRESTAENNIQAVISQNAGGTEDKIVDSESSYEVKINLQVEEENLLKEKDPSKHSRTSSWIHKYQRQGKAKASSNGDVNGRMSNENNDSHESVESCNSAGLLPRRQKRCSFEHESISGRKRVKRHFEESPGPSSSIKGDSSFLNWIFSMMKGFKSTQDKSPCHTLALAQSSDRHENHVQKLTFNRTQEPSSRTMGFQSFFQSLYSPRIKPQGAITFNGSYQAGERSNEPELANKACDINAVPISCYHLDGNVCSQLMQSNEKPKDSTSMDGEAPMYQLESMPLTFDANKEDCKMISMDNNTSHNFATVTDKHGMSSNSSHRKCKAFSVDTIDPGMSSEVKPIQYRGDSLSNSWITRFTPKTSGHLQHLDSCTQNMVRALNSTDGTRNFPQSRSHICSLSEHNVVKIKEYCAEDQPVIPGKEMDDYVDVTDCFNRDKGPNDQKCISKPNFILPSTGVRNSEAMVSVFSRRLDALKQIIPPGGSDNGGCETLTCFFCGIKGHRLQDCPQIMDAELRDLLKNTHLYNAEEYPSLCLRCFQSGHWAVACPNLCSREEYKSKCGDSFVKNCSLSDMQFNGRHEVSQKLLDGKGGKFQDTCAHTGDCNDSKTKTKTDSNMNWTFYEVATSAKLRTAAVKRTNASGSGENELKRNHIVPLCDYVSWQVSDVPKGIFDAVRSLRLSRANILKWLSSQMPFSSLDGFFLRLRLRKWEDGLGGTGYYVACITGIERDCSTGDYKHSISVKVDGFKCLVESQYISNHDFHEDELLAWWSVILRGGGEIPSENVLRLKVEEKKMLGF